MFSFDPKELDLKHRHQLLIGGVAPRPIALVSTQSKDGMDNLAPFSFFNAFGSNPPVIAFSAARRGRNGTTKDTYNNLMETQECVVHIVHFDMVEQMNMTSTEYPTGIDEFTKSGFTKLKSDVVKPFRVKESRFHMECKLREMVSLGDEPASGNLAICDVVRFHIAEDMYVDGRVMIEKMDQVARNGGPYYTRAFAPSMFQIVQPTTELGVGYDQLPKAFKDSHDLSANDLGQLATVQQIPSAAECKAFANLFQGQDLLANAKVFLGMRKTLEAWKVLSVHFGL
jgi:flavin reductase (DIM6/NTAB) family NADH-FMN oxidoreductase RutF